MTICSGSCRFESVFGTAFFFADAAWPGGVISRIISNMFPVSHVLIARTQSIKFVLPQILCDLKLSSPARKQFSLSMLLPTQSQFLICVRCWACGVFL